MSEILTQAFLTALVAGAILAAAPLMFAALGETLAERSGVLNLGLEGMMLMGAYAGFVAAYLSDSVWLGLLLGTGAGVFGSLIMALLCVRLGLNQIVVGIAITLAGEGITSVLAQARFEGAHPRLGAPPVVAIPLLSEIPVLGHSLFVQPLIVYIGLGLAGAVAWLLHRTNAGLNLRAAGQKPEALDVAGVNVLATRTYAELATGAFAGLGGAYLSVFVAGAFTPFMTQGQGFMAIVIAMLARGKASWVVAGSFLFGICLSITSALNVVGVNVPTDLVSMLPYVAVMVALIVFARSSYIPPALCVPYTRGAR